MLLATPGRSECLRWILPACILSNSIQKTEVRLFLRLPRTRALQTFGYDRVSRMRDETHTTNQRFKYVIFILVPKQMSRIANLRVHSFAFGRFF